MIRSIIHYGLHFAFPFLISFLFFRDRFFKTALVLLAGIVIDIDHILASPVFDPNRCSINYHPLHSYEAICIYALLFAFKKTRILGLALLIHILADTADCLMLFYGETNVAAMGK
ncbi:DUF6122 family protein [Ascidiimonas aurantiaca]|uniref:DUF6122 family protein n=1 Tax=Ascidiimonas aurantiaca TaxID=1685432 RepID=UPI0030EFA410